MNTPVNFKIAQKLKDLGFDIRTEKVFYPNGEECNYYPYDNLGENNSYFWRPTIIDTVKWIFDKYKYSIEYFMNIPESGEYEGCYVFIGIVKSSKDYKLNIDYTTIYHPTQEKSLIDAIEFTLNELL